MFQAQRDQRRPSLSRGPDTSSESDNSEAREGPEAPLKKADMRRLLKEATTDIKAHAAAELKSHISGLKEEIDTLTSRNTQAETQIEGLLDKTNTYDWDLAVAYDKITWLEDSVEDLNNRSRRNNIQIRGMPETIPTEAIVPTLWELFQLLIREASARELTIERAHRALHPPALKPTAPRDIIVRMLHFATKEQLRTATRGNPPKLQDHMLQFFQDLAPSTLCKRRELKPLTTALSQQGWRYMWGQPFKLIVKKDNQTHTLHQVQNAKPCKAPSPSTPPHNRYSINRTST
ncbi:Hypothetical predicted protein [Pelobates cultripes]|uniref:Uncharacterized protein n=1 Tax=Pelobates cultripes TaxID=61616 RepID=A0AAD1VKU6_PELCU|nr:Hypothetical predicted protein [Pelobates cultripes]